MRNSKLSFILPHTLPTSKQKYNPLLICHQSTTTYIYLSSRRHPGDQTTKMIIGWHCHKQVGTDRFLRNEKWWCFRKREANVGQWESATPMFPPGSLRQKEPLFEASTEKLRIFSGSKDPFMEMTILCKAPRWFVIFYFFYCKGVTKAFEQKALGTYMSTKHDICWLCII